MLPVGNYNVARTDGYGQTATAVLEAVGCQIHVELQPVEHPAEGLVLVLFAMFSVAPELQDIDLSLYSHE